MSTVDEIRANALTVRGIVSAYPLCLDATIDDYPIGRNDRGQCRLQVERQKGKGYRTVRTTTDRHGRWCKPHKSVYSNDCIAVVTGLGGERPTRWVRAGQSGVCLCSAGGNESSWLIKAPHYGTPRRTESRYRVNTTTLYTGETTVSEEHVIEADPPKLCDAWDAWIEEYRILRSIVEAAWNNEA